MRMNPNQENQIIKRVQAGESSMFEYLVRYYQTAVFRILQNLFPNHTVEDLAQDVFLSTFAQIRRFDPERGSFRSWLFAIARNRALNARRKMREILLPDPPEMAVSRTPMDDLLVKEVLSHLDATLNSMPFRDRSIFVWAELEGLSYAEIARIEGMRLGTVKSRLARIRAKLKDSLRQLRN
jgi:RNA polymerase sigma-70 factor (ECF subfamily)